MTKGHTDHAEFIFTVKEFGDGTPFLVAEPSTGSLPALGNGFLAFELVAGTTNEKAREIAKYLNANVAAVGHTHFED